MKNKKNREIEKIREKIVPVLKKNKVSLRKLFGKHKFSKPTEQLMKEMDEELYNE